MFRFATIPFLKEHIYRTNLSRHLTAPKAFNISVYYFISRYFLFEFKRVHLLLVQKRNKPLRKLTHITKRFLFSIENQQSIVAKKTRFRLFTRQVVVNLMSWRDVKSLKIRFKVTHLSLRRLLSPLGLHWEAVVLHLNWLVCKIRIINK